MRLFVGLDLPWELRERLHGIARGLHGARWMPEENLHLTLRFVGEVPPPVAEEVDLAMATLRGKRFPLVLSGVGTHHRGGREVSLWVGVERNPGLEHLQGKVETALQRAGLSPEKRRFLPHVSLARLDNCVEHKLAGYVQGNNLFRAGPVEIDQFVLFSSQLGKEASFYTAEVAYPLS